MLEETMHDLPTRITRLHLERRVLRQEGVPREALERNRRKLVAAHRAYSRVASRRSVAQP
jgi:hypothetical protein